MNKKQLSTSIAVVAGLAVLSIFFVFQNPFMPASATAALDQAATGERLIVQDEKTGTGPVAKLGDVVVVSYVGRLKDGSVFDSSEGRTPLQFQLGDSHIIAGLNAGMQGMRVGGKRLLIIPSDLAYGAQQMGPIPPSSTLVFEITLLSLSATTTQVR